MPLFHRKSEEEKQQEARENELKREHEAEQAESLQSLEQGGLPVQARRRLEELSKDKGRLFTSDLSVGEFMLMRHEGLRPITQVMGSCFYHVGLRYVLVQNRYFGSGELSPISNAYDAARDLALGRMREEAKIVGASAVVGVRLKLGEFEWGSDLIEYTAIGTAVHVDGAPPADEPALTTLSGEDFWKLLQAGYGPVGVAAGNCVYYQVGWQTANASSFFGGWYNQELSDLSQGVAEARYLAQSDMHESAGRLGAEGVVGVTIDRRQSEREVELQNETKRTDMIFTFLTSGTAVAPLKNARQGTRVDMVMPLSGRGLSRTKGHSELQESME